MINLDTVTTIAQLFSMAIPAVVGVYAVWRRIDRRQTESHIDTVRIGDKLETMQKQLDVQFGGNGGGIREAINAIKTEQKSMDSKLDRAVADISNLRGKFDQHITESN